ncbi:class I SAM-dependent rRNA methyltransferase [Wolinella succinogenes]|uniref:class I SAM-dependent rRNA methyltransferase n=1 Tax=Wolinella succinogenes TaxID=844 RepID=UPI002FC79033
MQKVTLKKSALPAFRTLPAWIYGSQLESLPSSLEQGELVHLYSPKQEFLALGYINPKSQIALRILSFTQKSFTPEELKKRLQKAILKRESLLLKTNGARLIHSESDELPGLIVDSYANHLSLQINTAGMERFRPLILESLKELLSPLSIIDKSDEKSRQLEGLESSNGVIFGEVPQEILLQEEGARFGINLLEGQKTGYYLDQRQNRLLLAEIAKGKRVLDLFCNGGGFGIHALLKGAKEALFIDSSEMACEQVKKNLSLNQLENKGRIISANVFDELKGLREREEKFDLIILDPPSFAKTKEQQKGAMNGWKYLIIGAIKVAAPKARIALYSCSYHMGLNELAQVALEASRDSYTRLQILQYHLQDIDHPAILNMPHSLYLRGIVFEVLK